MTRSISHCFRLLVSLVLSLPLLANAAGNLDIEYNADSDTLSLKANGAYLDEVLSQLSDQLDFKVVLDGNNIHRQIQFEMQGRTSQVLNKLVQPNSIILSQDSKPPNRVTNVILLPAGQNSPETILSKNMPAPPLSGNAETNQRRQAHHQRRVERKLQGLGRNAETLLKDNDIKEQ